MASFFEPYQFGVAFPCGAEKIAHGLRTCIEQHWSENDFGVLKVDMTNAFNLVSRQAILSECAKHFHELLPWVSWYYGQHPLLWHHLGCLTSESGVQQGDPLGPLLFSLVLNILVKKVARDSACSNLPFHAWYLDDGVMAGPRSLLCRILSLLQEEGPALGIIVNLPESFISSLCSSGFGLQSSHHLSQAIETFNSLVSPADAVSVESLLTSSVSQKYLSVVPSENLGLHLDPPVFQVAIKWWLGLDTSEGSQCALCPGRHLITLATMQLPANVFVDFCHQAHLGVHVEVGSNLTPDGSRSRPADVLVHDWITGRFAAFDFTVSSPLSVASLNQACITSGFAALSAETRKHKANDPKCSELGWVCVPLAVETYGNWGKEARDTFSRLATRLAIGSPRSKSSCVYEVYSKLNLTLTRSIKVGFNSNRKVEDFNVLSILRSFSKASAAGPTGLRIQHLLDVAEVPVPTSICSLLRGVINLLASGQAPAAISQYMVGGSLVALRKGTQDIRPIAVGESLRRLTSKCLCSLIKEDASAFFQPFQFGVALPQGCEKVIHGLRRCLDYHWHDSEFVCLKVDMKNAFNLVSRQSLFDQCTLHFPLLLPWTTWCYGQHPFLWHSMGTLTSEAGVQQGDPLGPFYFALVLHHLVLSISKDESCQDLLFNAWYLDDGVVAGPSTSVQHVVCLLQDLGPSLGLHLNPSKCELFGQGDLSVFPSQMNKSCTPNLIILGAPIGEVAFCSSFIASKRAAASTLLSSLVKLGSCDPQIALILLRMCGGFTKLVHVARSTPPSLALDELHAFDEQVRCTFTECQAIDTTDSSWMQAQLSLSRGGLGLRSLAHHSNAAFIASISTAGLASPSDNFLADAVNSYNRCVPPESAIDINSLTSSPCRQHTLSAALENIQFNSLFSQSSVVSSPHASAWLSVVPSPGLGLSLDPNEHQMAIKWWLGLNTSPGSPPCALCPEHPLDPLGHHAVTCKRGSDAISRHNKLRDIVLQTCHRACISAKAEAGSGLGHELRNTRPADILASNWLCGKPAAFDLTVVSPLNPTFISEVGRTAGSAAVAAELRKHSANDAKCSELGWTCIPLVAESYGAWGSEAVQAFSRLASYLATRTNSPKSKVVCSLYGRLNLTLVRADARALLLRCGCSLQEGDISSS
eukprot:Em0075g13a